MLSDNILKKYSDSCKEMRVYHNAESTTVQDLDENIKILGIKKASSNDTMLEITFGNREKKWHDQKLLVDPKNSSVFCVVKKEK